jgi:hypothetical protein
MALWIRRDTTMGLLGLEIDKRSSLILLIIIIFVIIIIAFNGLFSDYEKSVEVSIRKYHCSGIVVKKFNDKSNHNFLTVKLSSGEYLTTFPKGVYGKINLGDSLHKKEGEIYLMLFKENGEQYKINLLESENL